jgi:hypothetical protein
MCSYKKFSFNFRKSLGAFLKAEFKNGPASIHSALSTTINFLKTTPADDSSNDLSAATGITAALDSEPGILLFVWFFFLQIN